MQEDKSGSAVGPALVKKKLFLVIIFMVGKAPNLDSLREGEKFLLSLQPLNCLQLKIICMQSGTFWGVLS